MVVVLYISFGCFVFCLGFGRALADSWKDATKAALVATGCVTFLALWALGLVHLLRT